jgi:hypothetical protein
MRECLRKGLDPEGNGAPTSLTEALEKFFGIRNGNLTNLTALERTKLANNIIVLATGQKSNPCYSIIDKGEGQTPARIPQTFLSLTASNKFRIPFVQGLFNMGGTGSFQFCGNNNLQLIISKRDPQIAAKEADETGDYWGFTIIRREDPKKGERSSTFTYLAPDGEILKFKAANLLLLPGDYPSAYERSIEWGSFIKLYEYQLTGLKAPVFFDLYNRLSLLLPNLALPVLLCERRKGYQAKTYHTTLSGLSVRLEEDKRENLEPGFPSSSTIKVRGQEIKLQINTFKKEHKTHYAKDEGIVFTVGGQSRGFISKSFLTRKSVGMSYLADSILIIADCSTFSRRTVEDLFMNSRDRLRQGDLKSDIVKELEELIKNHSGLRELRARRRIEDIEGKIGDEKPLVEVLEEVIKKSPTLAKLFVEGIRITSPFNTTMTGTKEEFRGERFPTYFNLKGSYSKDKPKYCPINQRFRLQFETDAENSYFVREIDPGKFSLSLNGGVYLEGYVLNLWNGIATLTVQLPEIIKVGEYLLFHAEVTDVSRIDPFINDFYIYIEPEIEKKHGGNGTRKRPPDPNKDGEEREKPSHLDIPHIREVRQDEWEEYKFDRESALLVRDTGENGYDFYINMDNVYLLTEIKGRTSTEPKLLESQYRYGMVLLGISLLREFEGKAETSEEEVSVYDQISSITKAISPVLLPMISSLGELNIEE